MKRLALAAIAVSSAILPLESRAFYPGALLFCTAMGCKHQESQPSAAQPPSPTPTLETTLNEAAASSVEAFMETAAKSEAAPKAAPARPAFGRPRQAPDEAEKAVSALVEAMPPASLGLGPAKLSATNTFETLSVGGVRRMDDVLAPAAAAAPAGRLLRQNSEVFDKARASAEASAPAPTPTPRPFSARPGGAQSCTPDVPCR